MEVFEMKFLSVYVPSMSCKLHMLSRRVGGGVLRPFGDSSMKSVDILGYF